MTLLNKIFKRKSNDVINSTSSFDPIYEHKLKFILESLSDVLNELKFNMYGTRFDDPIDIKEHKFFNIGAIYRNADVQLIYRGIVDNKLLFDVTSLKLYIPCKIEIWYDEDNIFISYSIHETYYLHNLNIYTFSKIENAYNCLRNLLLSLDDIDLFINLSCNILDRISVEEIFGVSLYHFIYIDGCPIYFNIKVQDKKYYLSMNGNLKIRIERGIFDEIMESETIKKKLLNN